VALRGQAKVAERLALDQVLFGAPLADEHLRAVRRGLVGA
jgi:hypothetical protein